MSNEAAIRVALDLMHMPSQVRFARTAPLPQDVQQVLQIAAGDAEAERLAAIACDRPPAAIRAAATFYIEQTLLFPDADCYRMLGCAQSASAAELRRNMALLLRWLHPDKDREGERSALARRVSVAWDTLKTPERRASYDASVRQPAIQKRPKTRKVQPVRRDRPHAMGVAVRKVAFWLAGYLSRPPATTQKPARRRPPSRGTRDA
jgi:hypothetical protein